MIKRERGHRNIKSMLMIGIDEGKDGGDQSCKITTHIKKGIVYVGKIEFIEPRGCIKK